VPPSAADRSDLVAEARLRTALAREPHTRGAPSLTVRVHARTAFLGGNLPSDVHDLVYAIARRTTGVLRVECAIRDRGRRRRPETHHHHGSVAALPPPPSRASVGEIDLLIHRVGRDRAHGAAPDRTEVQEQDRQS
jgi:hypothetical protein